MGRKQSWSFNEGSKEMAKINIFDILIDESFSVLNTDNTLTPTNNKKILSLINDFEGGDWRYVKFQEFIWNNIVETAFYSDIENARLSRIIESVENLLIKRNLEKEKAIITNLPDIDVVIEDVELTIPKMLSLLQGNGGTVEFFFEMERNMTFKMSSMLNDINFLYNHIFPKKIDISSFITKMSYAFLPRIVYELEEYGLPRMISRKIQNSGILNLEEIETPIHSIITQFNQIGLENIKSKIPTLHPFELYILEYFYDGIRVDNLN